MSSEGGARPCLKPDTAASQESLVPLMQFKIIAFLILASSAGAALAQAAPVPIVQTAVATATSVEVAEQKAHAAAIADCEAMWDRGTHMTRNDWSRTCRRVQNRLQQLDLR
jgi:hypothetical protein